MSDTLDLTEAIQQHAHSALPFQQYLICGFGLLEFFYSILYLACSLVLVSAGEPSFLSILFNFNHLHYHVSRPLWLVALPSLYYFPFLEVLADFLSRL